MTDEMNKFIAKLESFNLNIRKFEFYADDEFSDYEENPYEKIEFVYDYLNQNKDLLTNDEFVKEVTYAILNLDHMKSTIKLSRTRKRIKIILVHFTGHQQEFIIGTDKDLGVERK